MWICLSGRIVSGIFLAGRRFSGVFIAELFISGRLHFGPLYFRHLCIRLHFPQSLYPIVLFWKVGFSHGGVPFRRRPPRKRQWRICLQMISGSYPSPRLSPKEASENVGTPQLAIASLREVAELRACSRAAQNPPEQQRGGRLGRVRLDDALYKRLFRLH